MIRTLYFICIIFVKKNIIINWIIAKLDYHMSMLFACMAGGEGMGIRGFKIFCQRVSEFFLLALCVCGGGVGWGGGAQVQYLFFREKKSRPPLLLINDCSL